MTRKNPGLSWNECVRVKIASKDRKVGAMVKALAVEVAGHRSVRGAKKEYLAVNGFYVFRFPSERHAEQFRKDVNEYFGADRASIV